MARTETWFDQDLKKPVSVRIMAGTHFTKDNLGSLIGVRVYDGGEPATLTGGVEAYCILADGQTITVSGTKSENRAWIVLPQSALDVPGPIQICIKNVDEDADENEIITTLLACVGTVLRTQIGVPSVPGSVIDEWSDQITAQLGACQDAADNLGAIVAVPYVNLTFPVEVGIYTTNDGNLYCCKTRIAESESFTAAHWRQTNVCSEISDLKSAFRFSETNIGFYDFLTPNEFGAFASAYAYQGVFDVGTKKFVSSSIRISIKCMIRSRNKYVLKANSGYQFTRAIFNGPVNPDDYVDASGWSTSLTMNPGDYYIINIRKSNNDSISASSINDAIYVVMAEYNYPVDNTLLLQNVPADAKKTGQEIAKNTSRIRDVENLTVKNLSETFNVYNFDTPEKFYAFCSENIILGTYNSDGTVDATSTIRAVLPIVFKTKNKFKIQTKNGYLFGRNLLGSQVVPYSERVFSGWQTSLVFQPNTYYNLTFKNGTQDEDVDLSDLLSSIEVVVTDFDLTERFAVAMANNYHPIISVAHRGRMDVAPENTMPAFIAAVKAGFKYIETDVLFTSDGEPVCIHDATINRTSDGTGYVSDMTYEELQTYDFGSWFSSSFAGTRIPSFESFIAFCRDTGTIPIIELKTDEPVMTYEQIEELIEIVEKYGLADVAYWSSMGNGFLQYIYTSHPTFHLLYGIGWKTDEVSIAYIRERYPTAIAQFASAPTTERLSLYKAQDIPVCVWTPSEISAITNLDPYISIVLNNLYHAGAVLLGNAVTQRSL